MGVILPLRGLNMKLLQQVLGWTNDTYLFELKEPLEFDGGKTKYVLHNYPSEFDVWAFSGLLHPADKNGNMLEIGSIKDKSKQRTIIQTIDNFWINQ